MQMIRNIDQKKASGSSKRTTRRTASVAQNESTSSSSSSSRRRKTEKEEDAELIHDEEFEEDTTVLTESPSYVHGKLRDYQIQGLNWLIALYENRLSGILADEMGLGKTLQTISFLGYLRYYKNIDGPFIVITPKSTLDNWRREFGKWTPDVNVLVLQGTKEERADLIQNQLMQAKFDVVVTSYEMVIREKSKLAKFRWEYIVIDEAHRIKNEESALSQIIRLFYSKNRLLITGTPLQNNLHELWALLNFILPDVFGDNETFDEWFESQEEDQDQVVKKLHKLLSPFLIRRVKADVEKSLLPKKEVNVYVGMTDMQVQWYRRLLEKDIDAVNGAVGKREGKTRLLNIVMQLRKCCNHPYLFEGAEPGPPYTTDEHLVFNSGKMIVLDKLLKKMKSEGSRVLIFSQMSRLLDILEDYCFFREYEYCRIDGSTSHEERIKAIDDYNSPDSDKFIFLLTTRAGGLGINLTSADIVVLYDSDWNPQADLQAMDRAHRIGQKKQVKVFRFVTENAIEEKVLERAAQKLRLDQLVIQQGRSNSSQKTNNSIGNSKDDLIDMIQHGAQNVFDGKVQTGIDDDIDKILAKGESKTTELNKKYSKLGLDDLQNFTTDSSAYEWNGENFAKKGNQKINVWLNPSKRHRKEQQYSVDNYYRDVMQSLKNSPGPRSDKLPRAPKQYNIHDFQFYPAELSPLLEKEQLWYKKKTNYKVPLDAVSSEDEFLVSDDEAAIDRKKIYQQRLNKRKAEQSKIENAEEFSEDELKLKEELLSKGFKNWNKRDFMGFIHGCAKYGREDLENIKKDLKNKKLNDVIEYSKIFWERYKEIEGYEKYLSQIEQGEKKLKRTLLQQELLSAKLNSTRAPLQELVLHYPPTTSSKRNYTDLEDRYLLIKVNQYGINNLNLYDLIKDDIMKDNELIFSFYFKSRTSQELSRRISTLLLSLTKEIELLDKRKFKNISNTSNNTNNNSRQASTEPLSSDASSPAVTAITPNTPTPGAMPTSGAVPTPTPTPASTGNISNGTSTIVPATNGSTAIEDSSSVIKSETNLQTDENSTNGESNIKPPPIQIKTEQAGRNNEDNDNKRSLEEDAINIETSKKIKV
ncbi:unnamed protein product [[Candida] boidinii]|uniref:Unnamed protein product n=1 Tax=Candida boidinii TaxID=5477 RepID=A0A9W6SYU1_CANBO|nr:hypothetical protein B5S30_g5269 [[Candida] boidinii]GME69147.1 unnamed protein product [[Candida] boidinii]